MEELPKIDPTWARRRATPAREASFLPVIAISAALLTVAFAFLRAHAEAEHTARAAKASSNALAAQAQRRLAEMLDNEQLDRMDREQAERRLRAAEGRSMASGSGRTCAYLGGGFYETGNCQMPDLPATNHRVVSPREEALLQAQARAQADAKLRAEEARFAALTGQGSRIPLQYSSGPREFRQQHCAMVKAERDRAYRAVGNNRTFDFIRHWDDVVYQACKNT